MQGLLKNVSGLPLCFKSLKTQACLQQHLPSTSAGCGQLFMLRLNMGVHFGLLGNKLWEVHLWLNVNTRSKATTLQSTESNHMSSKGENFLNVIQNPWRNWGMTSVKPTNSEFFSPALKMARIWIQAHAHTDSSRWHPACSLTRIRRAWEDV